MEQFSKEGRRLRPRKAAAASAATRSEKVEYRPREERGEFGGEHRPRRSSGEHKTYGEHKPYGEHRNFGEHRTGERKFGEHKPFGRRTESGEHRTFGERGSSGERKFGGRKPFGVRPEAGERRQFTGRKPSGKRNEAYFSKESEEGINRMISRRPQLDSSKYSDFDAAPTPIKDEVRLNKFIANSGVCSRREADTLIQAGVVTVNGEVVTELGVKVNIYKDDIRFNGERLKGEEKVYVVMNKPKGYVTTASDPHAEKTVMELLKNCDARVFPVGRLDKNTTGVLMFTNDGEIAERLTHPSYEKKKIYQVILNKPLDQADYDKVMSGVELTDGITAADSLEYIDEADHRKLGIEIHSGKNRIVRRIFESLGYDVKALDRVYFAGLTKKGLKKGEWRFLSEGEVNILKMGAYV